MVRKFFHGGGTGLLPADTLISSLVTRLESALAEPKSDLRQRRIKNLYAEAKFRGISLPALRALITGRNRLAVARAAIARLAPHRRMELCHLAVSIGETSELFQFKPETADSALDVLRA